MFNSWTLNKSKLVLGTVIVVIDCAKSSHDLRYRFDLRGPGRIVTDLLRSLQSDACLPVVAQSYSKEGKFSDVF